MFLPVVRSTVSCGFAMDGVGLTAHRNSNGIPLLIPPLIPPLWFVLVRIVSLSR